MNISKRKMALGLGLPVFGAVFAAPFIFWFLARFTDTALGLTNWGYEIMSGFAAAICIMGGLFWITWAYSYLIFVGKGLPLEVFGKALHPTKTLVATGPYAYTRNPLMLGALLLLLAVAIFARSPGGLMLIPVIAIIAAGYLKRFEERELHKRFGVEYEEYRDNVPILMPRLTPFCHKTMLRA